MPKRLYPQILAPYHEDMSENKIRKNLLSIFRSAVSAVSPHAAIMNNLSVNRAQRSLRVDDFHWQGNGAIRVLGAGKGAAPMAAALAESLGPMLAEGLVAVKYGHAMKSGRIRQIEAAHPVPDAAGVEAAGRILDLARQARKGDLTIVALTGGASALVPLPAPDIGLDGLMDCTRLLLASGAPIDEVNAVRKHLSLFGGGGLARAAGRGVILGLIVSDVIGDRPDVIASGPLSPDPTTFAQCAEILARRGIWNKMPVEARRRVESGAAGLLEESPKKGDPLFDNVYLKVIANNGMALAAGAREASRLGYLPHILPGPYSGEARLVAPELLHTARNLAQSLRGNPMPLCMLAGGECTVTLRGTGRGGRNQEMALAASLDLVPDDACRGAIFAGTDGTDGPTDAAGGFALPENVDKIGGRAAAEKYLADNDSQTALEKCGALLKTGPTLTNVMDICAIIAG